MPPNTTGPRVGSCTVPRVVRPSGCGGMKHIRECYGVPAKRGMRIFFRFSQQHGTITGARYGRLLVRFDSNGRSQQLHPTWEVDYLPNPNFQAGGTL